MTTAAAAGVLYLRIEGNLHCHLDPVQIAFL
jgi:hypothetical protein